MFIFLKSKKQVIAFRASIKIQRLFWKYVAPCSWPLCLPGGSQGSPRAGPAPGWPVVPRCHQHQGPGWGTAPPPHPGVRRVHWSPLAPSVPVSFVSPILCSRLMRGEGRTHSLGGGVPLASTRFCVVPPKFCVCPHPPSPAHTGINNQL